MLRKSFFAALAVTALTIGFADQARATPTQCAQWARGGQTGDLYELVGQELVTIETTRTYRTGSTLFWGLIQLEGGEEVTETTTVQFYRGTYQSGSAKVYANCSTGEVLGNV